MGNLVFNARSDRPIWGQLHSGLFAHKDLPIFRARLARIFLDPFMQGVFIRPRFNRLNPTSAV